jgi:hypothetical protein
MVLRVAVISCIFNAIVVQNPVVNAPGGGAFFKNGFPFMAGARDSGEQP